MIPVACCAICNSPETHWVEILDFAVMLCRHCLDGVKPVAVVVYDNKKPQRMAIELDSKHCDWKVRLCEMQSFLGASDMMYRAIDQLVDAKMAMI